MSLHCEVLTSLADLDRLRGDWESLLAMRQSATPFDTFQWLTANVASFRNQQIRVLAIRSPGEILGILPLAVRRRRKYLRRRNWLEFAGLPYADYGTWLVRKGWEATVANCVVDFFVSTRATWDGVYLDGLRTEDQFTKILSDAARQRGMFSVIQPGNRIRLLSKAEVSASQCLSRRPSKSLAKAKRRISQLEGISFDVKSDKNEILARLGDYFRMHMDRCRSKGVKCPLAGTEQQLFLRNVVSNCAPAGNVWLSNLWCGDKIMASRFSLRYGSTLHLYSTCFVPEFAKYSPSMLQLELLLEHAFSNGIDCVDFGIGDSSHKEKAGALFETELVSLELYHRRETSFERRIYSAAQTGASKSKAIRQGARIARKLFPHQV